MNKGTIKFFNETKGFGFIKDANSEKEYFVHSSGLVDFVKETDEVILKDRDEILIGKSIFRFVIGDIDDYSLPVKAGIFWIRILPKLAFAISVIVIVSAAGMIFTGIKGNLVMSSKPSEIFLERSDWTAEELADNWIDYLEEGTFDITPSPAVGDIDSDGNAEIIMSDAAGRVIAWSSKDGRMLWKMEIGQKMLTSPCIADVNTDGIKDVVVGSDNSRLYILDGASGQMLYKSSFIGGKLLFASSPLVHDLDGDGFKDIVVTTDDKVICFLYSPITG